MTVLLLIALGLARPALTSLARSGAGAGRRPSRSCWTTPPAWRWSMAAGRGSIPPARRPSKCSRRLREGDQVALLPTGGPPGPELGRLFRTHETVRQALDQCRPSYERADLAAKLQQARDLLAQADAPSKEIYVLTDNQSLSWEGLKEPAQEDDPKKAKRPGPAPVVIVNVNREPAPNVALQTVSLSSPAPVAGVPFQATVEVLNSSTVPQQKHLELQIDGAREAVSPDLSLPPGGTLKYDFRFTLEREGVHRGEVRLVEDDGSALDNRLLFRGERRPADTAGDRQGTPRRGAAGRRRLLPGASVRSRRLGRRGVPDHDTDARIARHGRPFQPGRGFLCQSARAALRRPPRSCLPMPAAAATSSGSAARTSSPTPTTP